MKKILSVLLTVALLLSFASCGKDDSNSQNGDKTSSNPTTSSSKPKTSSQSVNPADIEKPQFTLYSEDVYSPQIVRYNLNSECKGYYFTPKAKGKYPTLILMHGQGTVEKFKNRVLSTINNWVKMGYIPPMVVVLPEVLSSYGPKSDENFSDIDDFQHFIMNSYPDRFNALLTSIETGALSSQIGTDKPLYVSGFSMGGMAAVHAAAEYNTRIKHVGGLSPAKSFYLGDGLSGAAYKYAADIHVSKEPDARIFLAAGELEQSGEFLATVNRYAKGIGVNNPNIVTKFVSPFSWGRHSWELAHKEIFIYLYFATFDKIPSNELVEAVCNNPNDFKTPTVVYKEEEHK